MKDRIEEKLTAHIERIMEKDEITNEEFYILQFVKNQIVLEEKNEEMKRLNDERDKKFKASMEAMMDTLNY